jgi:hypothetical protein
MPLAFFGFRMGFDEGLDLNAGLGPPVRFEQTLEVRTLIR